MPMQISVGWSVACSCRRSFWFSFHSPFLTFVRLLIAQCFLVGLLKGCGCRSRRNELVGAFAVFLHHAPGTSSCLCIGFTAKEAGVVAQVPALLVHVVSASDAGVPLGVWVSGDGVDRFEIVGVHAFVLVEWVGGTCVGGAHE